MAEKKKEKVFFTMPGCVPCKNARERLKDKIEAGEVIEKNIEDLNTEQLDSLISCLQENNEPAGSPIFAEVVDGEVVGCKVGGDADTAWEG